MEEKEDSLANNEDEFSDEFTEEDFGAGEGEEEGHEASGDDFFSPSKAGELEEGMDHHASDYNSIFAAAESDPLSSLLSYKTAEEVVKPGDLADLFESDAAGTDARDFESDHEDTILGEVMKSLKIEEVDENRDTSADLKAPKSAGKKAAAAPIRKIKVAPASDPKHFSAAEALFGAEDL
jgi:hypothetical protein